VKKTKIQNSFTSGEFSDKMLARWDFVKYPNACRTLENFLIFPEGGVFRRPGTYYTTESKTSSKYARLIEFIYSDTDSYILELGDEYIRFYRSWGQVLDGTDIYEVSSPYDHEDLALIQYVQSADVMFLTHGSYAPRKLSRTDHTDWTLEQQTYVKGPFLDENTTTTTIESTGTSGSVTLSASASIFEDEHVGSLWRITHAKESGNISGSFTGAGTSSSLFVKEGQKIRYVTRGKWTGQVDLERSYDNSNWETVWPYSSENDDNTKLEGHKEELDDAYYRVNSTALSSGKCTYKLIAYQSLTNGVVEITAVASGTSATATTKVDIAKKNVPTKLWAEGSWSDKRGWPQAVGFYEQRLWYARTSYQPNVAWSSVSFPGGDFDNFLTGTDDDDAIIFGMAESQAPVEWLVGDRGLILGTSDGAHLLSATSTSEPLTPTNLDTSLQGISGSARIMPTRTDTGLLYVERGGKRVNEFVYSWEQDSHITNNMTRLAEHIAGDGIKETAFQKRPERILWCCTDDGQLICMTYLPAEQIIGWCKHPISGTVESVAVIPGKSATGNASEDEVWLLVNRTIKGATKRYIERMMPWDWGDGQEDAFFVDCGITYDGDPVTEIDDLDHLEGETVSVCADGGVQTDKVVTDGKIQLDSAGSVVHIGIGYTSTLKPMRPAVGTLGLGSVNKICRSAITFYKTAGAQYGTDEDDMFEIPFRDFGDDMDTAIPLFTGTKELDPPGGYEREGDFIIQQDKPLPCSVLAIVMEVESA